MPRKKSRELVGVAAIQGTAEQIPPGGASDSHRHTYESLLGKPAIPVMGPASQLDANGTILDVNVINAGELLVRVGTTIVSQPAGAPGLHHLTHETGGLDEVNVAGLLGVLAVPQHPIIGAAGTEAVAGNDARLTNARTPTAHAATHQPGGADPMAVDAAAATGSLRTLGAGATQAASGTDARLSDARTPTAHHATHEPGGGDPMAVDAAAATGSLRTLGAGATQATSGTDARLSDARTPLAHAASHAAGGGDPVTLTEGQITNLVTDLAAKALLGVLAGSYDLGSVAMLNAQFLLQYKRLTLTGAERLTIPGTSNALLLDLGTTTPRVIGSPKTIDGAFILPSENFFVQRKRLNLCCQARGSLLGTASLILEDDFESRSRIALTGRG